MNSSIIEALLDFDINSYDNVQTANGRIGITFLDDSQVRLTEHSKLIIDEYIFNPNPDKSKMSLTFASGTIRFVSGSVNKLNKNHIACGELLIKEAGGYLTNLKYVNAYDANSNLLIGANPILHKEILKKINHKD